jgi:hypothetical protein
MSSRKLVAVQGKVVTREEIPSQTTIREARVLYQKDDR